MQKLKDVSVLCPDCGVVYQRDVDVAHIMSPDAWMLEGNFVILCDDCYAVLRLAMAGIWSLPGHPVGAAKE